MSTYDAESELSRFNQSEAQDAWFPVAAETAEVVAISRDISRHTGGRFDVTLGPLVNLWGFGPEPGSETRPSETELALARQRVGFERLELRMQPPALRKEADIYVDLSAVAKGYGVDAAAALLEALDIGNYLIEIGGEMRVKGLNERGSAWRIAIETPLALVRSGFRTLSIAEGGIATSGDYRNYFEEGGVRYSHIIDPLTASPITHSLASVTIIHPRASVADGWATALLVMGPESGFTLAQELGLAALFIVRESDGFAERFTQAFLPYLEAEGGGHG